MAAQKGGCLLHRVTPCVTCVLPSEAGLFWTLAAASGKQRPMSGWLRLCEAPRIWISERPILSLDACQRLIAACLPAIEAQAQSNDSSASVDYRSVPASTKVFSLLQETGVLAAAAEATGIPSRPGEDIQIARTAAAASGTSSNHGILNLHHDRHKQDHRVATFMVNLATIDSGAGLGGETYFPAAGAPPSDELAAKLRSSFAEGVRFYPSGSSAAEAVEERLRRCRQARSSRHPGGMSLCNTLGVVVEPVAGRALLFDSGGGESCDGEWHAPCAVSGPVHKWTITIFKSPAPVWSSVLVGV